MRIKWILITVFVLFALLAISSVVSAGITYNTASNKIIVTGYTEGAPCNFSTLWTADKAGNLTLWTGTSAINITLTTQIKPSDELSLKIDFILVSSGAGAGDTINITGTDKDGNAQSETLTTESNGTFTTTKWFKTITDIDCNGFSSGTLTVRQNQWGVVSKSGDCQFEIDSYIDLGDGTVTTWFKDINKQVLFHNRVTIFKYLHLQFGDVLDINDKTVTNGSALYFDGSSTFYGSSTYKIDNPVLFYDSTLIALGATSQCIAWLSAGGVFWGCITNLYPGNTIAPAVVDFVNTISRECNYGNSRCPITADNWQIVHPTSYGLYFGGSDVATVRNVKIINPPGADVRCRTFNGNIYMIDCECGWIMSWKRTCSGKVWRQYSVNLKVTDKNGTSIGNATVILKDKNGDECFSVLTSNENATKGEIIEQIVSCGYYKKGVGNDMVYSPHTLQISHQNYSTSEFNFTLDKKIDWTIPLEDHVWNYSQPLAWKIINLTDTTILKLSSDGNLAIAGVLYELTNTPPPGNTVAYQINDTLWLTKSGDLYIEGNVTEEINAGLAFNTITTICGVAGLIYYYRKKKKGDKER